MEAGGKGEEEVCGWCVEKRPNSHGSITPCNSIYENVILPLKITKMQLWASNLGPFTQMTWK